MSWIRVENDKPFEGSEVMITFENEVGRHVGEATYENNKYMYAAETDNGTFYEPYSNVIAWMPKPLAYTVTEECYKLLQKENDKMKAVNQMRSVELAELRAENDRLKNEYEDREIESCSRLNLNNKVATKIVKGNIIKGNIFNNKVHHIEPDERDVLIDKIKEETQFRFMDSKVVENIRILLDEYEYPYKKENLNEDD